MEMAYGFLKNLHLLEEEVVKDTIWHDLWKRSPDMELMQIAEEATELLKVSGDTLYKKYTNRTEEIATDQ